VRRLFLLVIVSAPVLLAADPLRKSLKQTDSLIGRARPGSVMNLRPPSGMPGRSASATTGGGVRNPRTSSARHGNRFGVDFLKMRRSRVEVSPPILFLVKIYRRRKACVVSA
jgi:hypothetical protein